MAARRDSSATITVTPATCVPPLSTRSQPTRHLQWWFTAGLSVGNNGTFPFTYQWYQGSAGDTSNPISGANQLTFTTPALTQTTSYWFRSANSCGTVNQHDRHDHCPGRHLHNPAFTIQPQSCDAHSDHGWTSSSPAPRTSVRTTGSRERSATPPHRSPARAVQRAIVQTALRGHPLARAGCRALAIINGAQRSSLTRAGAARSSLRPPRAGRADHHHVRDVLHRRRSPPELSSGFRRHSRLA